MRTLAAGFVGALVLTTVMHGALGCAAAASVIAAEPESVVALPEEAPKPTVALRSAAPTRSTPGAKVAPEVVAEGPPAGSAPATPIAKPAAPDAPPPEGRVRVDVPGDRPVLVYLAPPEIEHAIVYLHGHCGSPSKIDAWASDATRFGTVIALLGNRECDGAPGRFRWGMSVRYLNQRIVRAVERVKELRGGLLDVERLTLIGYSQGAEKAELLPRWFPERYPRIVLAGPPAAPHPWLLAPAKAIVVIAGENEKQEHIRRGFRDLQSAGELAAFMVLPAAAHGEFGPEGAAVMGQALWWLFDRVP